MTLRKKRNQKTIEISKRRENVVNLLLEGKTQNQVAEILNISQASVSLDWKSCVNEYRERYAHGIDEARTNELMRVEQIEKKVWDHYHSGKKKDPRLYQILLEISKHRSKLLGLLETVDGFHRTLRPDDKSVFHQESVVMLAKVIEDAEVSDIANSEKL